ncbi:MAG: hypothetical protein OXT67_11625 [Zetaproteobacteria bacterium]|nr:hypothetical protein [Zetaproteobacteria bacterium]
MPKLFGKKTTHQSKFDTVTRVAIEELMREHGRASKYGLFFDDIALEKVVEEVARLFMASRNLKDRGDRLLGRGASADAP